MVLDELHGLVVTLQGRIAAHGPALQQSEALTRYALIDPLLRALGWDTGDPSQVVPEFRSDSGSADYALLGPDGKPRIILEAKKLGTPLDHRVRMQVANYCQEEGVPFAAITDGRRWEIYDIFQPAAMKNSLVAELDLSDEPAKTCLKALALWRASVVEGNVAVGVPPVVGGSESTTRVRSASDDDPTPPDERDGWHRLSEFKYERGNRPVAMRFHDRTPVSVASWPDCSAALVGWLRSGGHLLDSHLPITLGSADNYFLNRSNDRRNGQKFIACKTIDGWFMNTNYNPEQHITNMRNAIRFVNLSPRDFAVKLQ